ncbi:MAG: ATP-binding cassette domain-containing protein, partial [bacterium]
SLLCGANGSGKSTLLQMANGIVRPDRGSVLFKGERLKAYFRNREPIHGRIGLLFQNAERQLFSETVRDDIAFGPRNLGLSRQEVSRRVREAALWVGLDEDVLSRPVHTLSGGQMRRAAVAGVLAMDPELLVLDEPTDGLDPAGTGEFFQRAHDYCRSKGTTILMAGHRIPDQAGLLDHVAYLRGGKVVLSGPPSRVLGGTSGALPEGFLPEHLKVQNYLRSLGILTGDPELDPARALDKMLRLAPGP